jgi:hypothetical protein
MRREEAASSNGQDTALSRLRWEFDSPRCYQVMSTQTIELEGFEIELASELYCDRGGDHRDLVDRARTWIAGDLGHNVDESAVLCVRCMKAIVAESVMPGRLVAGPWILNPDTGVRIAPRQPVLKSQQRRNSLTSDGDKFEEW